MRFEHRARIASECVSCYSGKRTREHALAPDCDCKDRYGICLGHAYRRVCAGAWQWVAITRTRRQRAEKVVS